MSNRLQSNSISRRFLSEIQSSIQPFLSPYQRIRQETGHSPESVEKRVIEPAEGVYGWRTSHDWRGVTVRHPTQSIRGSEELFYVIAQFRKR